MSRTKPLYDVGSICVAKDGKNLYIKVKKAFEVEEGDFINLELPKDSLMKLLEKGFISEEELEMRLEKIPSFIKYNLHLPARKS